MGKVANIERSENVGRTCLGPSRRTWLGRRRRTIIGRIALGRRRRTWEGLARVMVGESSKKRRTLGRGVFRVRSRGVEIWRARWWRRMLE